MIGTHALLQEGVDFADLGLVVVDEQHRFGVEQRDALRAKGSRPPHVLVMTATPIPRTVAMTVYGDLEISTLRQLPSGRGGVASSVVPMGEKPAWLDRAWQRLREEVAAGRQAYVVCPRIGDDEGADDEPEDVDGAPDDGRERPSAPLAVLDIAELLRSGPLAGLRLDVLHGRLTPEEKDARMRAFAAGEIDVLVATTVVEVGVDVPNATVMVVMDADRFGVSQLHQLRGRVARGKHAGLCLLVTEAPRRVADRAAARRGRGDLRRLRAGPPRPRDPARGRHPRCRAVRPPLGRPAAVAAPRTRSSSPPPAPRRPPCSRPSAGSPTTRASPPRSPRWPPTSARSGWRRRDRAR